MKDSLRKVFFKFWYWYISKIDKNADVLFMNWGYEDPNEKIVLHPNDEPNRYSIQLYHRLAKTVDLKGKDIVEVGCGRGGGLDYVTRTFQPANALGIDLEKAAADFGNKQYKTPGLRFMQGDAQNITLADNSYDVVLNVESSHRYPDMHKFLSHVDRILKPNGHFLLTDFRSPEKLPALLEMFKKFNFSIIEHQRINPNVLQSLSNDTARRKHLVRKYMPKFLHKTGDNFAGVIGSPTYKQIEAGEYEYFVYIFRKNAV